MARRDIGSRSTDLYRLFLGAQKGDSASRDELLGCLRPRILRLIRYRVSGAIEAQAVAEDITQDVLVRVNGAMKRCDAQSETQFMAWVFTIARNAIIDWRRQRMREHVGRCEWQSPEIVQNAARATREPVSKADRLVGELLLEAQRVLSPDTQEVIRQRLLFGATWRAAGEAVGTTAGGARRRWQRAVARLEREILQRIGKLEDEKLRQEVLRRIGLDDTVVR